jgi:5-methylcytosine-specific restriction endonuclease McrA
MDIIQRKEAKDRKLLKYFTGNPCPKGHIAERYTGKASCTECLAEKSRSAEKKEYDKQYLVKNAYRIRNRQKKYHHEHKKQRNEKVKQWQVLNADKVRAYKNNYKYRRRAKEASGATWSDLNLWEKSQKKVCYWCGSKCADNYHVDHYEPLSKGGLHEIENLVIACATCNLTKSAKDPYEFAQKERGRLF